MPRTKYNALPKAKTRPHSAADRDATEGEQGRKSEATSDITPREHVRVQQYAPADRNTTSPSTNQGWLISVGPGYCSRQGRRKVSWQLAEAVFPESDNDEVAAWETGERRCRKHRGTGFGFQTSHGAYEASVLVVVGMVVGMMVVAVAASHVACTSGGVDGFVLVRPAAEGAMLCSGTVS